jgi:Opioid growth factor receptor (OGFr) conserved region
VTILLEFFEGRARTDHGLNISDLLTYSDRELEADHQYIQWLFPNQRPSRYNPSAPLATPEAIEAVQASPEALSNFRSGLSLLTAFYVRNQHWLRERNHNHLRITRIIEATALFLDVELATQFLVTIEAQDEQIGGVVSEGSRKQWRARLQKFEQDA